MKKLLWLLPLTILMACGPSTTELLPATANNDDTGGDTAVSANNTADEATDTNDDSNGSSNLETAANLDEFAPAAEMAEAAETRAQDWRKGATDPLVVIIEYGDFQ